MNILYANATTSCQYDTQEDRDEAYDLLIKGIELL